MLEEDSVEIRKNYLDQGQDELELPPEVIEAYKDAFRLFDKNNDGSISAKELGEVINALGCKTDTEFLENLIKDNDFDGSGQIEFNEFIKMMSKANKEQDLREAFKVFDKNGDGKISKMELKTVLESLGQHLTDRELDDMMNEADTNHDGAVDFEGIK
ncbi:hypothetical protein KUTeg_014401 [Tegillarca granosa]|uniref:EF-hand domain-containing protein n=1 Tax=Tegillarca granosa TaxID=220873 RepID=A0ABQ9EZX3_TEGGR|nr:hypothetical protein KUTeg_014401 [Tegillarca granosa]